jgi:hypothetical protein
METINAHRLRVSKYHIRNNFVHKVNEIMCGVITALLYNLNKMHSLFCYFSLHLHYLNLKSYFNTKLTDYEKNYHIVSYY